MACSLIYLAVWYVLHRYGSKHAEMAIKPKDEQ